MQRRTRVAVLFGGRSPEHEVSVVSARGVLGAMDRRRFEAVPVGITREGVWLTPEESAAALRRLGPSRYEPLSLPRRAVWALRAASRRLRRRERLPFTLPAVEAAGLLDRPEVLTVLGEVDVVFPLIHGPYGEDGSLQGLLELIDVPYVGAGIAASALGLDKGLQKALWRNVGLPVVPHVTLLFPDWKCDPDGLTREIEGRLGYPVFVKPANGGSSVGVTKVRSREDLAEAVQTAAGYDRKVLVEQAVAGREIECSVLGNDQPEASPLGEIIPRREFYDYAAKYLEHTTELVVPAELAPEVAERIREAAVAAFRAIDGAGMARVDFFVREDGEFFVSEINTIPGFTPISMYPRLWQHAGLSYSDLVARLVELALERYAQRRQRG